MTRTAVLIAGPTASGKSALALELARRHGGVVVNADSMQVYRDLRILSARPTVEEEAAAPHRLYGHVDGAVNYSAGKYAADSAPVLAELAQQGRLPLITGGTGLYFRALTEGLSDMPAVPDALRAALRAWGEGRSTGELHAELTRRSPPAAAALRPSDRLRIERALEIVAATGHPPAHFHARREPGPLAGWRCVCVFLAPERSWLHARINARFEAMVRQGALEEVAALAARHLDPKLPIMRAHGVPALMAHLRREMTLADAIERGQGDTRAYVKRQFTWFRQQMPGFVWRTPEEATALITSELTP